ncbi:MAG: hypothetical protein LBH46_02170, partial [Rickettsiales bacterium]|jgi:hypothetical protein|nr:hypothetical protein [Rickettsiales bacterium]
MRNDFFNFFASAVNVIDDAVFVDDDRPISGLNNKDDVFETVEISEDGLVGGSFFTDEIFTNSSLLDQSETIRHEEKVRDDIHEKIGILKFSQQSRKAIKIGPYVLYENPTEFKIGDYFVSVTPPNDEISFRRGDYKVVNKNDPGFESIRSSIICEMSAVVSKGLTDNKGYYTRIPLFLQKLRGKTTPNLMATTLHLNSKDDNITIDGRISDAINLLRRTGKTTVAFAIPSWSGGRHSISITYDHKTNKAIIVDPAGGNFEGGFSRINGVDCEKVVLRIQNNSSCWLQSTFVAQEMAKEFYNGKSIQDLSHSIRQQDFREKISADFAKVANPSEITKFATVLYYEKNGQIEKTTTTDAELVENIRKKYTVLEQKRKGLSTRFNKVSIPEKKSVTKTLSQVKQLEIRERQKRSQGSNIAR